MSPSTLANLIAPRIGARHMLGFFLMIGPQSFSSSAIIKSLNAAVAVCEDFSVFGFTLRPFRTLICLFDSP